ncbi:hypothetical protein [uncultured Paraglaciecola sp.]|uniref:hypothetical protein n=1 Tax=uncultured Paraglaciecola sp. TaxID=1765024 RepID=UPI002610224C|nr:hypothetical protein [uncultured Paraglaciecola sp.]
MGEIADAMISGDMCQECGQWIGDGDGYPVSCSECGGDSDPHHYNMGQGKNNKHWKAQLRESAPKQLEQAGIPFTVHNNGAHLIVKTATGFIDFWPGKDRWKNRTGKTGFGVCELIERVALINRNAELRTGDRS